MKYYVFLISVCLTFLFINLGTASNRLDCNRRTFDDNSFVCVCNASYCDTIEQVDRDQSGQYFQEFVTSKTAHRLEKFKHPFESKPFDGNVLTLSVNRSVSFQHIKGFGGAITDAAGANIYSLSTKATQNILNAYFSPSSGIEYNILRIPLAGTDFSLREYSYADNSTDDFDLKNFSLQAEDIKWKIPFTQAAIEMSQKKISLFASPWSAPKWMKTNNDFKGMGTLIGPEGGQYYETWAKYYLKFFEAYKKHNLTFWALTAQNEPSDGFLYRFSFNCMGFTPESQAVFITKNLGPLLKSNGFPEIKIMILDDQRIFLPTWPQRVLDFSPETTNNFDGIAVHWYLDAFVNAKLLDMTHDLMPDKWIFASEACAGSMPFQKKVALGMFDRAEQYAHNIIQDLNHWVTGWTDWNLALNMNGGPNWANNFVDSAIIVNPQADEFYKQPMFYAMGQFSKFVREGSVRVELTVLEGGKSNELDYVAFYMEDARETVVVILNKHDVNVNVSIYDTDSEKYVNVVCEGHSIRTIVWFS